MQVGDDSEKEITAKRTIDKDDLPSKKKVKTSVELPKPLNIINKKEVTERERNILNENASLNTTIVDTYVL